MKTAAQITAFAIVIAGLLAFRAFTADTPTSNASPPGQDSDEIVVVLNGFPVLGRRVFPANDKTFKLVLSDSLQTVELYWKDLETMERIRIKQLYGLDEHDGRTVWGKKLTGLRLRLASGKEVIGLHLPDRDGAGRVALKTAHAPLMLVPEADIQSREKVEAFESEFYSPQEVYQRWVTEKPPGENDAAAHLDMARRCVTIGLYHESLEHLTCAEVIDPRTRESMREFRAMVLAEDARRATLELYQKLQHAIMTESFVEAADFLAKLDRNFPTSEFKSRWDALRPKIEVGLKTELKKQVIPLSYSVMTDLLRKEIFRTFKFDAKGNMVLAIPGKQIVTTHGDMFKGTLAPSGFSTCIGLKAGDMVISIEKKDIQSMTDVQLDQGDTSEVHRPAYDQVLAYVSDTKKRTGLKAEMIGILATKLKAPEESVREVFDGRIYDARAHYEDGKLKKEQSFTITQEASYGKGSWLRPGAKPKPRILEGKDPAEGARKRDESSEAEFSDDPGVWWEHQDPETQFEILRAIAAEHVFKVKKVIEDGCAVCGGQGTIAQGAEESRIVFRCPLCRGTGVLYKIRYE